MTCTIPTFGCFNEEDLHPHYNVIPIALSKSPSSTADHKMDGNGVEGVWSEAIRVGLLQSIEKMHNSFYMIVGRRKPLHYKLIPQHIYKMNVNSSLYKDKITDRESCQSIDMICILDTRQSDDDQSSLVSLKIGTV